MLAASIDLCELSGPAEFGDDVRSNVQALSKYWDGTSNPPGHDASVVPPYGKGSEKYYDDNAWIGLGLLRAARVTGDASMLDTAQRVFRFIALGWDTNTTDPHPGGVFWTQASNNHDRNTVSTAPSAELALRLHELTGNADYLVWATRMHDWVNATLRDPADGLYWDHVSHDGAIDTTKWSYNQGNVIGVRLLLGDVAGAEAITAAALGYYERVGYFGQDPAFNAIFFRNLFALADVSDDEQLRRAITAAAQQYAEVAWEQHRTSADLFVFGSDAARLIDQAALVQIFGLLALRGSMDNAAGT